MNSHQTFVSRAVAIAIFLFTLATFADSQTPDSARKPAGSISGRMTLDGKPAPAVCVAAVAGQSLNRRIPAEPNASENVLRFYEAHADLTGAFTLNNVAPGSYWIVARPFAESAPPAPPPSIRRDGALRTKVLPEAQSLKKALTLKPCEELKDFDLMYSPTGSK